MSGNGCGDCSSGAVNVSDNVGVNNRYRLTVEIIF